MFLTSVKEGNKKEGAQRSLFLCKEMKRTD